MDDLEGSEDGLIEPQYVKESVASPFKQLLMVDQSLAQMETVKEVYAGKYILRFYKFFICL